MWCAPCAVAETPCVQRVLRCEFDIRYMGMWHFIVCAAHNARTNWSVASVAAACYSLTVVIWHFRMKLSTSATMNKKSLPLSRRRRAFCRRRIEIWSMPISSIDFSLSDSECHVIGLCYVRAQIVLHYINKYYFNFLSDHVCAERARPSHTPSLLPPWPPHTMENRTIIFYFIETDFICLCEWFIRDICACNDDAMCTHLRVGFADKTQQLWSFYRWIFVHKMRRQMLPLRANHLRDDNCYLLRHN